MAVATRTVTGKFLAPDGTPAVGELEFTPSNTLVYDTDGNVYIVTGQTVILDANGAFSTTLMVTDDVNVEPNGWLWYVDERIPNGKSWYMELPTSGSPLDISTIYPTSNVPSLGISNKTYIDAQDALKVDRAGDTMTADLEIDTSAAAAKLILDRPAGYDGALQVNTNDVKRWLLGANTTAEGGSNAGSDLSIKAYDDNGSLIAEALKIMRATGAVLLYADPTDALGAVTKQYVDTFRNRNYFHNPALSINQRQLSSRTTDGYVLDRWKRNGSGGTISYGSASFVLGDTSGGIPESPEKYAYITTSGQSAASDYAQLSQALESVRILSNRTVTVSFWARVLGGGPASFAVSATQWFGTGGSPSSAVVIAFGKVALSGTFARYSLTATIPSISGKTLGSNGDDVLQFNFWTSAGSDHNSKTTSLGIQNEQIDLWGIQAEVGSTATPFEIRSISEELLKCQRYFVRLTPGSYVYGKFGPAIFASTTIAYADIATPVLMRKPPSWDGSSTLGLYDGSTHYSVTKTGGSSTQRGYTPQLTGTGFPGAGYSCMLEAYNSLSAYIDLSADL